MAAAGPGLLLPLLLWPARAAARSVSPLVAFLEDAGGSGEAEGAWAASSSPPAPTPTPAVPATLLDGLADFLRRHALPVAVAGALALLLLLAVCAALVARQQRQASAYRPSSFPAARYVDRRDAAGGTRGFGEVPVGATAGRPGDARDAAQQLRADILAATQGLRPPARAERSVPEAGGAPEEPRPGDPQECGGPAEGPVELPGPCSPVQEPPAPAGAPESPSACDSSEPPSA